VVYGAASSDRFFSSDDQIREGATVRERQPIITIPNMSMMSVKVKVHETYIQKMTKGLKAKITVDAFPNEVLPGEVLKVGLLPDSQNRWMNPDNKVYQTTVAINATNDWLKPGMSAKVELLIKQLHNVVYVPLQAVSENDGKHYCRVVGRKTEQREVEAGDFNDEFIVITKGIKEGEKVSLKSVNTSVNETQPGSAKPKKPVDKPPGDPKPEKPAAP
jgi:HlyD family secretion protein